jgi:hypothetical protein
MAFLYRLRNDWNPQNLSFGLVLTDLMDAFNEMSKGLHVIMMKTKM